jgi:hypothetical protein
LLLPEFAVKENSRKLFLWRAGLRQLAEVRRVVFPLRHPDFALDNDDLSHGARTWTNLLGLMCAHGWLEQRNRDLVELPTGERAIVATPWDYRAAYEIFKATCTRTIVNLGKTHRKIVDAVYTLKEENADRDGFSQRGIARKAGISSTRFQGEDVSHQERETTPRGGARLSPSSRRRTELVAGGGCHGRLPDSQ